jgi:hypothetical protein
MNCWISREICPMYQHSCDLAKADDGINTNALATRQEQMVQSNT